MTVGKSVKMKQVVSFFSIRVEGGSFFMVTRLECAI